MKKSSMKPLSYFSSVLCASLMFAQTVFAGGSSIQLTTDINPNPPQVVNPGKTTSVIDFGVHVEPQFIQTARIKTISVSCFAPRIMSRAYLLSDSGRVLGSAVFKNDPNNMEGGDMITANIRPIRVARIAAGDQPTNFKIAIKPMNNAPMSEVECGVSRVSFVNTATRTVVDDAAVQLDLGAQVTQRISILPIPLMPIRIQGK